MNPLTGQGRSERSGPYHDLPNSFVKDDILPASSFVIFSFDIRKVQFPSAVPGTFILAASPRSSQSASGMMAVSATLPRAARIIPSVYFS